MTEFLLSCEHSFGTQSAFKVKRITFNIMSFWIGWVMQSIFMRQFLPSGHGDSLFCSIQQKTIAFVMFIKSGIALTGLMWFENIQDIIFSMLNYQFMIVKLVKNCYRGHHRVESERKKIKTVINNFSCSMIHAVCVRLALCHVAYENITTKRYRNYSTIVETRSGLRVLTSELEERQKSMINIFYVVLQS